MIISDIKTWFKLMERNFFINILISASTALANEKMPSLY